MRRLPLLLLAMVGLPLLADAQIITRPLSAQQRIEYERCMTGKAADDAAAIAACVRALEDGDVAAPTAPETTAPETISPPPDDAAAAAAPTPTGNAPADLAADDVVAADALPAEPASSDAPPSDAIPLDPASAPTQAEIDYAQIYGEPLYNPVADPTLPAPATIPQSYDPWESYNRKMHRFNNFVDRNIAKPLARAYVKVVPRPIRLGVSNFFNNLGQPVSAINALLQGKPKQAAQALGRFALNTTLGIGGIFDPASDAKLPNRSEDFGQTLGIWGWERSRYVELPLFGPRTVRDTFGMVGDAPLSPLRQVEADKVRIPLQGLQLVDVRAQLLAIDSLRAGATDDYQLVRDAWMQRRRYQIFGDRLDNGEEALPPYLQDDSNPLVPAGAMPVMPTDN